jgi:hypothetical protein
MAGDGRHFAQFAERGVADIGHILATSDIEMGKKASVPQGRETAIFSRTIR